MESQEDSINMSQNSWEKVRYVNNPVQNPQPQNMINQVSFKKNTTIINDYIISKLIGQGQYGTVYKVFKRNQQNQEYAIKILNPQNINSDNKQQEQVHQFQVEANVLKQFNHQNIVKYIEYLYIDNKYPAIVQELCEFDLEKYM